MAPAGYGKSELINKMQLTSEGQMGVLYCAPSGIAAHNIKGFTLHSAFGMMPHYQLRKAPINLSYYRQNILKTAHTLLIDEVSMLRIDIIDRIDAILQRVLRNPRPFGGLRVIFVGDLFQLGVVVHYFDKPYFEIEYKKANGDYSSYNAPVFNRHDFMIILIITSYNITLDRKKIQNMENYYLAFVSVK
jgi:hypothetical protein